MPETTPSRSAAFLGLDIGTSGVRAMAIDAEGRILARADTPLSPPVTRGACIEQDAELWWQAVETVLDDLRNQLDFARLRAIAVDGTSGTVLICDAHGQPLQAALMYNDSRAREQAARLADIAPPDSPVHTATSGLAKLLWLLEQPGCDNAAHYLHQADWIAGRLAGRFGFSDSNNALKTGFDAVAHRWPAWLAHFPLKPAALPAVYRAGEAVCRISQACCRRFGLASDTLIAAGTTDSTAAFIATGARHTGEAVTSLGSTLVLKVIADQPVTCMQYGIYSQPLSIDGRQKWLVGGASNSGGAVLRQFFGDSQMQAMEDRLQPDVDTGLDYLPLPGPGERFPVNDPDLAPRLVPRIEDDVVFFQGLLEGIAKIEKAGYQRLHECGAPAPINVRSSGGGAKNKHWTRIRENRLNVPLLEPSQTAAAFGAACLARTAYTQRSQT